MKKKILLIISMFLFMTNVKALTFDVNLTNIEDKGTGTLGTITNIDIPNKSVSALFEDIGAEISFEVTVTNTGDRAGTLREINVTSENESMEYTTNLPEGGLSINGNDTNKVTITGRVKEGAVNGASSSEVKIKYNYDEGSCPDGEILSDDESMCLCPEGMERNEKGVCVTPEKPIVCEKDEIYNETKKICEKKVVPVVPENPKTLDNIVLITLLFIVSGLGIYAVMYKRLKTTKKKVTAGVFTGVATLTLSFTVLAGVFGIDKLLGAIVNPITKSKEIVITVNEEIDLIETWDGTCSIPDESLTPENIFEGGTGTESDPYQVKTANQLACFARSINLGRTYQNQYIKQTKTIKLNDDLNGKAESNNLASANLWTSAGEKLGWQYDGDINHFDGTYDGNNKTISGLYITDDSVSTTGYYAYKGMFGLTHDATFMNMILSDVYVDTHGNSAALLGYAYGDLTLVNISTYGKINTHVIDSTYYGAAGLVKNYSANSVGTLIVENTTNNINLTCEGSCSGVIDRIEDVVNSEEPNVIFKNVTNNGNITFNHVGNGSAGMVGYMWTYEGNLLVENCGNNGDIVYNIDAPTGSGYDTGGIGGLFGYLRLSSGKFTFNDSYNTGDFSGFNNIAGIAGIGGDVGGEDTYVDGCYNSGNITSNTGDYNDVSYAAGLFGSMESSNKVRITNSYNTGDINVVNNQYVAGIVGKGPYEYSDNKIIENCYNTGNMTGVYGIAGIAGQFGGTIQKCYNTGEIYSRTNSAGGLVGYGGNSNIYYSYNTGTVTMFAGGSYVGGLSAYGGEIKNSYNLGDVIVEVQCADVGGLIGQNGLVTNSYNAGNIILPEGPTIYAAGIGYSETRDHTYNLGNITGTNSSAHYGGIGTSDSKITNSVNVGNITMNVTKPYAGTATVYMGGIATYADNDGWAQTTNNFNGGTVSINSNYDLSQDGHYISIGEIAANKYSSSETYTASLGNRFNTDPTKKALGCFGNSEYCNEEQSNLVGTYTDEAAPDILSVINGDDAFEIKEGDTLPTLKVFNE